MKTKLQLVNGQFVMGDKFWGRDTEVSLLTRKIDEGAHILLTAQRRMGKTSILKELQRRLEKEYLCCYVDFQKSDGPEDAVVALSCELRSCEKLWKKVVHMFRNAGQAILNKLDEVSISEVTIKLRAAVTSGDWQQKGDQLFDILSEADKPVLLLLDEVPILVNRILMGDEYKITPEQRKRADSFMSWLRANSLKHQGKIRIILSGSIGLEPVLRRARLSATISTFSPVELEPWDEKTAVGCLRALANNYNIQFLDDAEIAMVKKLGYCIPHHVQMFFSHVLDSCDRAGETNFSPEKVEKIYKERMLSVRGHAELAHYEDRLKQAFGQEIYPTAFELLTEAAVNRGSLTQKTLNIIVEDPQINKKAVEEVLRTLEHDGYFKKTGKGYIFESRLLKDWWAARHRLGYVPFAKRPPVDLSSKPGIGFKGR